MLTYFPREPYHERPTGRDLVSRYPLRRVMQQLRNRNEVLECGHEYWINCYTVSARRRRCKSCWVEEQQLKAVLGRYWDGVEKVAVFGIALPLREGWDYAGRRAEILMNAQVTCLMKPMIFWGYHAL